MAQRRVRSAGWGLLAVAVVVVAGVVTAGALRAHGAATFNRWVGWATVAALPLAAIGVALMLWNKVTSDAASAQMSVSETEGELAAIVLSEAQIVRSRLIGVLEASDQAANVRFVKGSGRFREVGGASQGDLATVLEYYQSLSPGRLAVLGQPGAGKTVLAIELLIRLLEHRDNDAAAPIPVLISAAAYDTQLKWDSWLAGHLVQRFGIGQVTAGRLVRDGRILPMVDGIDEMDLASGKADRARVLITALNASMHGRERAPIVVTSRRAEYEALTRGIDRATHVEMVPLTGNEAAGYLHEQFLDQEELHRWTPVLAALNGDPGGALALQLATPWRLTLALTAFREAGDPTELLPAAPDLAAAEAEEYGQFVDSKLLGRYVPAAVGLHDPGGRYRLRDVQRWLMVLADGLAWQARHEKSATDIRLDQWWEPTGRRTTRLIHIALVALPGLLWLVIAAIASDPWLALTGAAVLFAALTLAGSAPSPQRLRLRKITTRRGISQFASGLGIGLGTGLLSGLAAGIISGPTAGLGTGLGTGLAIGLAYGLVSGVGEDSPEAIRPRDVIRADGHYRLMVGLVIGLGGGLGGGLAAGLRSGLQAGLITGLAAALTFGLTLGLAGSIHGSIGSSLWVRYYLGVIVNFGRRRGPLRFGSFLDWAQQAGILRESGIAYQFRHRQLQDWLTVRR